MVLSSSNLDERWTCDTSSDAKCELLVSVAGGGWRIGDDKRF